MTSLAPPSMRFALVTGASRGLGHALCQLYLSRGWTVFPLVRRAAATAGFRDAPVDRCHPIIADVGSDDAISVISSAVATTTTSLDLLINTAGVAGDSVHIGEVAPEEIDLLLNVHCLGVIRCTQAVLPQLVARDGAKVVNVSSRWGSLYGNAVGAFGADVPSYSYRIAKAAQNMVTVCLSQELGREGIVVCALHPGQFRSGLNPDAQVPPEAAARRVAQRIDGLHRADHGKWYDVDGGEIPW
jgi:NAD(P)-dependent dehydrogenase (short-subunit alcohol dehydrogenase family)